MEELVERMKSQAKLVEVTRTMRAGMAAAAEVLGLEHDTPEFRAALESAVPKIKAANDAGREGIESMKKLTDDPDTIGALEYTVQVMEQEYDGLVESLENMRKADG